MGRIGSKTDDTAQFIPASVSAPFYLNTGSRASADGYITSVSYCYAAVRDIARLYQATVGLYERHRKFFSGTRYSLISAFNITKQLSDIEGEQFQCEDMRIPATKVEEGFFIGVCSTAGTIGRLNLVAAMDPRGEGLDETEGSFGDEQLCTTPGSVPMEVRSNQLTETEDNMYILRLYADIMESGNCTVYHFDHVHK